MKGSPKRHRNTAAQTAALYCPCLRHGKSRCHGSGRLLFFWLSHRKLLVFCPRWRFPVCTGHTCLQSRRPQGEREAFRLRGFAGTRRPNSSMRSRLPVSRGTGAAFSTPLPHSFSGDGKGRFPFPRKCQSVPYPSSSLSIPLKIRLCHRKWLTPYFSKMPRE